ncbi:MAG: integration host factor subunit alpha [Legionellales bacterium RIFCSPHIGHO2_12_FULL_42_9]|nr:MAG: integration host factor subunit alpha [Legionellales bacterium RIFCSPHIGHO2_12_FULL_42_9]
MNTLTKAVIIETLSNNLELSKIDAKTIVDCFYETIRQSLETDNNVKLSGFGNFILRDKKQRPGRNPKTGVEIPVSARRVVTFRAGIKLKKRVSHLG